MGLVFLLPHIGQDTIDTEDIQFRAYLESNSYDTSKMGLEDTRVRDVEGEKHVTSGKIDA